MLHLETETLMQQMAVQADAIKHIPRARSAALSSVGHEVRILLQRFQRTLAEINPHTPILSLAMQRARAPKERNAGGWVYKYEGRGKKRRRLKHFQRIGGAKRGTGFADDDEKPAFRKIVKAVRYSIEDGKQVRIGFFKGASKSIDYGLAYLVARQAEAKSFPITRKMRRFLFSAGMPVRSGTTLHRPARDWFRPVLENNRAFFLGHFNKEFLDSIQLYLAGRGHRR
jgi:hypothetical protein